MSSSLERSAQLLLNITNKLGVSRVQILYSEGVYGLSGRNALHHMAKHHGVCIVQSIEVKEFSNFSDVLQNMRTATSTKVILSYVRSHVVYRLAQFLDKSLQPGEFLFIGADGWGAARHDVRYFETLVGSIVVAEEIPENKYEKLLENYLANVRADFTSTNHWTLSFIQEKYDCFFSMGFDKTKGRECDITKDRISKPTTHEQLDPWAPYLMNAMFAMLKGANRSLEILCKNSGDLVCEEYRQRPDHVIQEIQKVRLNSEKNIKYFDEKGDGNFGFVVYNFQKDNRNLSITKEVRRCYVKFSG